MFELNKLQKINDYLYEIPQTFRADMRVPARIYATEEMLKEIVRDRSLNQLVNIATLPGIQKYALSMPDIHEGYGFPIGGVAAFNLNNGVISPGGIGYDINCLHPKTVIFLPFGTYAQIKDLKKISKEVNAVIVNKKTKKLIEAKIIALIMKKNENIIYEIETAFGNKLKATGEHPIFNGKEMVEVEKLQEGDILVCHYFNGVKYEKPSSEIIIDKKKIFLALKKLGLNNKGNRLPQIIKWLDEKNLTTLNYNSFQIPYFAKILGFVFGDGVVNLVGKNKKGLVSFYGSKNDLKKIKADLQKIGIRGQIYSRIRQHTIKNNYNKTYIFTNNEHRLQVNSTAFVVLLYALGVPLGNKTKQKFSVPWWIKKAPLWQQRLFVASFFGAEMSTPRSVGKYTFASPALNINKNRRLVKDGIKFLNEIKQILKKLAVDSYAVKTVKDISTKETAGLRFQIANTNENLLNFFQTVGFEYNNKKQRLASLASAYLSYKIKVLTERKTVREKARLLYAKGQTLDYLLSFANKYCPRQFIEHSIWSLNRDIPRIAFNFPSFKEFIKNFSCRANGLVFDKIESIKKIPYQGLVYDITVNDSNHNFFANGIVVSNCGVRLLKSNANILQIQPSLKNLSAMIYKEVPSGVGRGGMLNLNNIQLDQILLNGAGAVINMGYGKPEDINYIESNGKIEGADPSLVSPQAKARGRDQLGTMGAGNHFVEVDIVENIFDEETAKKIGLFKGQIVILIHTGSRGLGHQVATDYIRLMMRVMPKYNITLPDRELACVPFKSPEGQNYFKAMSAAANFAFANRQMITFEVRGAWKKAVGSTFGDLDIVYDVAHNIAKIENGQLVHRKGATRAFPGQVVLIPGSMGTRSYVLLGQEESLKQSFGSTCHGAGRRMSRSQAKREIHGGKLKSTLENQGVFINAGSLSGLAEEAPNAYKSVDDVVEVVHQAGIAKKIARLKPVAVIKG